MNRAQQVKQSQDKIGRQVAIGLTIFLFVICGAFSGQAIAAQQPGTDASVQAGQPPAVRAHDDSYIIGADDVLAIDVWKEPDLTRSVPVRLDGRISLPLVGELQAAGRTPSQLEHDILEKLRSYMTDPEVTVMVAQVNSKKFNILGQVSKPGTYALSLAPTVMDAIAAAGGFKDFAKQKGVYILRPNPDGTEQKIPFNYKSFIRGKNRSQNVKLEPHDTVIVP